MKALYLLLFINKIDAHNETIGLAYKKLEMHDKSLQQYRKLHTMIPHHPEVEFQLATMYPSNILFQLSFASFDSAPDMKNLMTQITP
jgi:hypothetical protein